MQVSVTIRGIEISIADFTCMFYSFDPYKECERGCYTSDAKRENTSCYNAIYREIKIDIV